MRSSPRVCPLTLAGSKHSPIARILLVVNLPRHRHWSYILVALLALVSFAAGAPSTSSTSTATTRRASTQASATSKPATQLSEKEKRRKLMDLMRRSIDLMGRKKYAQAEAVLQEALALDPKEYTNLYNMACLKALTGHKDAALDYLERSADAGFIDFIHIANDKDLTTLRDDPRYKAFIAKKDDFQRKVAEETIKDLKKRFGEDYLYEIDTADKLLFATNTDRPTLDALKANLIRQAHSQWGEIFEHKPDQYIAVVVPSPQDYKKIMPMQGVEGFYNHSARTLIAKGLGFVTTHEFTHALHAADLDWIGQDHPIWLVEGMAVLFERTEWESTDNSVETPAAIHEADVAAGLTEHMVPRDNMRLFRLQAYARQNRLIPLEKIFKMEQPEFVAKAELCYAQSGSVMHYLYSQGLLRAFYDNFKKDFEKDKTARTALEKTVGKPLAEFEADWKAWMMKRIAPPIRTGPNDPYLGIVFGSANDGLQVRTVVATPTPGPAMRAGVKVGDVIVGIDDLEVRDEAVFIPLLSSHKPGDTIVLRIRRDRKYLEIPMVLGSRKEPKSGGAASRPTTNKSGEIPPSPPIAPPLGARRDAE